MMAGATRQVGGVTCRDVDGVPVLTSNVPGPLRGVLLFRVGQADESLPTRGITHLVEHLALTATARGPHAFNGATGDVFTSFVVSGDPTDVAQHLGQVCTALHDLPFDRLEHERGVIRTEAARRGGAFGSALSTWRWGAQGFGLLGFDELGLPTLNQDQLQQWAATKFTASNAVLWLSGPIPRGLHLRLPAVQATGPLPLPAVDAVIGLPAAFTLSDRGVAFSYLAPRKAEGTTLIYALSKRLQTKLRDELGVSYQVESNLQRLTRDTSLHAYFADSLPENADAVQQGVTEVLESILEDPASDEEMAELRATAELAAQHQDSMQLGHLDYIARQLLLGGDIKTAAKIQKEQEAVTPASLRPYARSALSTLLAAVPNAGRFPAQLASPAPEWSVSSATGKPYAPAPHRSDVRLTSLIVGPTAISALVGANAVTVSYADCAAMIRYGDGARTLIAKDAFRVAFAPGDWIDATDVPQLLDLQVPEDRWIAGGDRESPAAPTTATRTKPSASGKVRRLFRWRNRAAVAAVIAAIGGISSLTGNHDPGTEAGGLTSGTTPVITAVQTGDCLLTAVDLELNISIATPCSEPHQAEVVVVRRDWSTSTGKPSGSECRSAARKRLTPDSVASVVVRAITTDDQALICYAESRSGDPLNSPLPRR